MHVDDYDFGWDDGLMRTSYTADFETTTDVNDCRVWAVGVCEIGNIDNVEYGKDVPWFIEWCEKHAQCNVFFHNLAFDGAFIMDWLERNGWTWVERREQIRERTYMTVINDVNQVYCIDLYFTQAFNVRIMDSLKVIPLSIRVMAGTFGMDEGKGDLDYEKPRPVGYEMDEQERDYLRRDVQIAAKGMETFISQGLTKMTAGSNALADYKGIMGGKKGFRSVFPMLDDETDAFVRNAYRGGFTYVNPRYQGKRLKEGIVFDVNSLYPSVMYGCDGQLMPYGRPLWFEGKPKNVNGYPLWVAQLTCKFDVREDHIPCIQLKNNFSFASTEYIEHSNGDVTFTITNVDWELIRKQYYVHDVRWQGGYMFQGLPGIFKPYIDKWVAVKNDATVNGNQGMRTVAKLMMNSLYGKFGTRKDVHSRRPMLVDDVLRYVDLEPEQRDGVYLPVAVFVTSYGRYKTISTAQSVYDRFVYADTDSVHLVGTDIPEIDVDDVRLGAWKHESTFQQAKFLRAKCYAEEIDGKLNVKIAGMPANVKEQVTLDNFELGAVYDGKLYTTRVNGGIVLVPGTMKIKE